MLKKVPEKYYFNNAVRTALVSSVLMIIVIPDVIMHLTDSDNILTAITYGQIAGLCSLLLTLAAPIGVYQVVMASRHLNVLTADERKILTICQLLLFVEFAAVFFYWFSLAKL